MADRERTVPLKLLVAVDGSAHSDAAVRWVASLKSAGLNAHCVLLNVQPPIMSGEVGLIAPTSVAAEARERGGTAVLERAAGIICGAGVDFTRARATEANIGAAVLASADAHACAAIVLGRRGRGALRAALLGSVSASVVQRAAVPVILVNHDVHPVASQRWRVVLAADGSQAAKRAAGFAVRLASCASRGEVHVLHVRPDVSVTQSLFGPTERLVEQLSGVNEVQALDEARDIIERAGCTCAIFPVVAGEPHDVILREATNVNAVMIAMGTRGLAPVSAMLMGSVAQNVVQLARVPVLLAR